MHPPVASKKRKSVEHDFKLTDEHKLRLEGLFEDWLRTPKRDKERPKIVKKAVEVLREEFDMPKGKAWKTQASKVRINIALFVANYSSGW